MPTTINLRNLDDELVTAAKVAAAKCGVSLKEWVCRCMRDVLAVGPVQKTAPSRVDTELRQELVQGVPEERFPGDTHGYRRARVVAVRKPVARKTNVLAKQRTAVRPDPPAPAQKPGRHYNPITHEWD